MIEKEEFPRCFKETTLHMVGKGGKSGEGKITDLFVWFPRLVEDLIFSEGSSMYQVGGQPVHRAKELKFSIRSIISKYRYQG